jgi:hypothetical protein
MGWFSDTAVYCLSDFISKSTIWLLNGHAAMTPLLPLRVDRDGIPVFRLLLNDIPTLPGLQFTKVFPNPEKFHIYSVMYFTVASQPFCIIKAHSFDIVHALSELVKGQIFLALQLLIGRISIQCTHCQCVLNNDNRRPWLNAAMPRPNFTNFSTFSIADALRVIQDNLKCPIVSTNQINSIGHSNFSFHDSHSNDTTGDQPIRL